MHPLTARLLAAFLLLPAGCALPPYGSAPATSPGLSRIEHIVVIYAENRSFDNLYGLFRGANGVRNAATASWTQTAGDGSVLPVLPPVWKTGSTPPAADPAYPTTLPNQPFRIDAPPINLAPS